MSSVAPLPVLNTDSGKSSALPIDLAALQQALSKIEGEVRIDRLSRALYSTDASVYQIVPVGVVLPKPEADIAAVVAACTRFRIPLTARGGGTSQAGQAIGPGLVLDCSKYFNRILEINAAERWVRLQPGCVLDDLNDAVKKHNLHFPIDISTSNRATLGGMIANNSSGTHSLIHGKTIDHVLELRVLLSDGSIVHLKPLSEAEWDAQAGAQTLEGAGYRLVRRLATEHADEIERRYPKILRRVGGYNLDAFSRLSPWGRGVGGEEERLTERKPLTPSPSPPRGQGSKKNLAHLFVGSEGTLGVTLEAKLRLLELPKAKAVVVVHFTELLDALAATPLILKHNPSAVEVTDKYILDSTKLNAEAARLRDFIQGDPGAILIVEFYGDAAAELPPRVEALVADLKQHGYGYHYHIAKDAADQTHVWKLRKLSLGLSMLEKGDAKALSFVEDTAVSPERLRDYIAEFLDLVRRHGTTAGVYAHASVGCLHVRPVVNLKTEEGMRRFQVIADDVADLVLKYGGALSGEHGDGLVRSPFQEKMFGPALYQAFREIKRTFDPKGIFNPGKIVDAPPLVNNLRYGPAYVTPTVPTTFDFSADGGIVQAAELCAGVGECRKKRDGSMCPSYRATCDEQHSTRGRANALRFALTGQLDFAGLTDDAVKEALDLCLECKACKSECPTNVDMARLKAEFLHQYYKKHGLPWRNWLFGNVHRLGWWAPRSRLGRWLSEKIFGIDCRRVPPGLATESFVMSYVILEKDNDLETPHDDLNMDLESDRQEFRRRIKEWEAAPHGVLFFPDTFTDGYEPEIGIEGARVLRRLGYRVIPGLPLGWKPIIHSAEAWPFGLVCCGRPMISNGMLDKAVELARRNVEALHPWAAARKPIIACEPSCILTIKDDYPALLRGEERRKAEVVAAACQTFEEFLESAIRNPQSAIQFRPGPKKILVQAHCHQRSLVGMRPIMNLLRRIPGAEVIDLDAGCCGMAGSFGYEKEHYEISRLVGEQRLFPAIRAADPDTVIVAPGFSCRMQIEHFTGRKAVHPAELLHSLLADTPW
jgi:FAD/FMN-containing dehydrogenase/Fe-S oxidoreductase